MEESGNGYFHQRHQDDGRSVPAPVGGHLLRGTTAHEGLIKEANVTAGEIEDKAVLDAAIVANSQAVEHYEISRYGTLIAWAEELGHDDVVRLLTTNLNEEKAANTKLNSVALRKGVNRKASAA
jgi:ferritin-like metal-binding protein YciE